MALRRYDRRFPVLPAAILESYRGIAASVVGDALNRERVMVAAIKPLAPGMRLCGQARTVSTMAGDNAIIHAAIPRARAGEILVIDAAAVEDVAVWGEVMSRAAIKQGIAGIVLDGATRDAAAIRALGFPMFCRAVVPRGPHKGFGGTIDGIVSVGGVAVAPGDLVVGDDDGVAVVPLAAAEKVLDAVQEAVEREERWFAEIADGRTTVDLLGLPEPDVIGEQD